MFEALASSSIVAWPLALTLATVVVSERTRRRRRRELLNRSLHELRRPLQALTLSWPQPASGGRDHLGLALEALGELDRRVNGEAAAAPSPPQLVEAKPLAFDAVRRWRGPARCRGRTVELRWRANGSRLVCDRAAVARALDNLLANAVEHGRGPIQVEGSVSGGKLRIAVADGRQTDRVTTTPLARPRPQRPGRGQGLKIVAEIAADHGGRFAACAHGGGAKAILELPLAEASSSVAR
jgi:signal transduction histidine kinase